MLKHVPCYTCKKPQRLVLMVLTVVLVLALCASWRQRVALTKNRFKNGLYHPKPEEPLDLLPPKSVHFSIHGVSKSNTAQTNTLSTTPLINKTLVLSMNYPGQQGTNALCLSLLQCFLSSIYDKFYILEPYLENSHFTAVKSSLKFSTLFNLEYFNSESRRVGYPEMLSLDEFARGESVLHHKYVIIVYVRKYHKEPTQEVIWSADTTGNRVDCFNLTDDSYYASIAYPYKKSVNGTRTRIGHILSKRCLVRVIDLEITRYAEFVMPVRTASSVFNFVFDKWDPQDVMLVFTSWPRTFVPVKNPLSGVQCIKENIQNGNTIYRSQFQASRSLIRDAEKYERIYLGNQNRLAIMFRVERVIDFYLREKANAGKTIEGCFQEVLNLKADMENNNEALRPLVTLDVGGKYGTNSFKDPHKKMEKLSQKMLQDLYHNKSWSIAEWEKSFVEATGGVTQDSYIAALQRLLASRADCMILMGGGNYQAMAVADYFYFHKTERACVHLVCTMTQKNIEVQQTLKNYMDMQVAT